MNKQDTFTQRAKIIHNNFYDYSNSEYISAKTKTTISCPIHGQFEQTPDAHLHGSGCKECGIESARNAKQKTTSQFIEKSRKVHGDLYSYKKSNYTRNNKKLIITCKNHGDFKQIASDHLSGKGCSKCGFERTAKKATSSTDKFIDKANKKHNDYYNYDKVDYKNAKVNVIITCPVHGDFEQKPYHHTQGSGCQKCGRGKSEEHKHDTKSSFIEKVKKIHGDTYDYSLVDYKGSNDIIDIICKKHGVFSQRIGNHLNKQYGCPKCNNVTSKAEKEIVELLKNYTKVIEGDRNILGGAEIDIYLPEHDLAIEYNGLYWHSDKFVDKNYHITKTNKAKSKGVRLIHIFDDEWVLNKEIVKSRLLNLLNLAEERIYARKTKVKEVPTKEAMEFLDKTHIQGKVGAKIKLGLYHNDELVSLMTFGQTRINMGGKGIEGEYELLRFCNKLNTSVVGGASKLLSYFIKNYNPKEIISYADRRWSVGNVYEKLGFKKESISKPNYFYTKGNVRENRFKYRKSELIKEGFLKDKTEKQIMQDNGYMRIYDCGTIKYKLTSK